MNRTAKKITLAILIATTLYSICSPKNLHASGCQNIEGQMTIWNGWPPQVRIETTDKKNMFAIEETESGDIKPGFIPEELLKELLSNTRLTGTFCITPTGQQTTVPYDDRIINYVRITDYKIAQNDHNTNTYPLEKKSYWLYKGEIKWTIEGSEPNVKTKIITWKTAVHEVLTSKEYRIAIITGFPNDIAWYKEGMTPQYSLLVQHANCIYWNDYHNVQEAENAAKAILNGSEDELNKLKCILDFPLTKGKKYNEEPEPRTDNMYAWYVENVKRAEIEIRGYKGPKAPEQYTITHKTVPDHTIMEFVPGLGITRYLYDHHGTVAFEDLRLVEYGKTTLPNKINLQQYRVDTIFNGKPAKPNFSTNINAREYRTAITEQAKKGPNFAGHYTFIQIGCGTGCVNIAVVDAKTGHIYLPRSLHNVFWAGWWHEPYGPQFTPGSRLLIVYGQTNSEDAPYGISYFEWTGQDFELLHFEQQDRGEPPTSEKR